MKILILSDTHGDTHTLQHIINTECNCDAIIFLGDGLADIQTIIDNSLIPLPRTYLVRGNCDFSCFEPSEAICAFGGLLIFFTHGNGYDVKWTLSGLKSAAKSREADIVLFGHTHTAHYEYNDGMYMFNPGAISRSSSGKATYGIIEITDGVPKFYHREVKL